MRALVTAASVGLVLCLAGCGGKKADKVPMKLEEVPPEIMKIGKEKLPDVTIIEAFKDGPNYELRGKTKTGKVREVDIAPDGKVVELD